MVKLADALFSYCSNILPVRRRLKPIFNCCSSLCLNWLFYCSPAFLLKFSQKFVHIFITGSSMCLNLFTRKSSDLFSPSIISECLSSLVHKFIVLSRLFKCLSNLLLHSFAFLICRELLSLSH